MSGSKDYRVNLFRPRTPHGASNTKMILSMLLIWFVSIFGFQFLLIALGKPTPEKNYLIFEKTWPSVVENRASIAEKQDLARVVLAVLGKNIALKSEHKTVLKQALSGLARDLLPAEDKASLSRDFSGERGSVVEKVATSLGLKSSGFDQLMRELLPSSLVEARSSRLSGETIAALPGIMELYLIHNQSVLTDTKFLGFPFHYFYISEFLLFGFVFLCLVYCIATDRIHKKHGFMEDGEDARV